MTISDILRSLEEWAPPSLQESYDNAGLLTGNRNDECRSILLCLDSTEAVIDEAIQRGCNLVIAHHPIVFSGLKRFTGEDYTQRAIIKAIKNNIAIYAIHTNLDNVATGVSREMADRLGLLHPRVLQEKTGLLRKLVTFCPAAHADTVRMALFDAGAGTIGNYDQCSFNTEGTGTFRAGEDTDPFVGKTGELHREPETRIEVIFPAWKEQPVLAALRAAHPYEEIAYDCYQLTNSLPLTGAGITGELPQEMPAQEFLQQVKSVFGGMVRHTVPVKATVKTVALCGGSGSFLLRDAIRRGADVFITADFKYHQFFDANDRILIADIGHFESEQFTMSLLHRFLSEKFPTFAVLFTSIQTNPVHYL